MDFLDDLSADEASPEERQAALLQALRLRMGATQTPQQGPAAAPADLYRAFGNLGMMTGDRVLSDVGKSQLHQAAQMDEARAQVGQHSLQAALAARRDKSTEQHQRTQEELQRQGLAQGRWSLSNPGYGQTYKVDGKTGQVIPVGDERVRPPGSGAGAETKEWKDFMNSISTVKGRGNLNADNQKRLYASERLKALATDSGGKPMNLSPAQLQELATMSVQLAAGTTTQSQIEHMMPKGKGMKVADIEEWLTDAPHGAGQQAFVAMMLAQAEREEKLIHGQLLKGQSQAIPNYVHLRGKNKDKFDAMLEGAGIDPSLIDDRGLLAAPDTHGGTGGAGGAGLPKVTSQAEYDALPAGAEYLDPNGKHKRKEVKHGLAR